MRFTFYYTNSEHPFIIHAYNKEAAIHKLNKMGLRLIPQTNQVIPIFTMSKKPFATTGEYKPNKIIQFFQKLFS